MKHTMMVLLVAVTLLTATGIATLAADGTNGGDDERPAGVQAAPTDVSPRSGDEIVIAGRKRGVGVGSTARSNDVPTADVSGPKADDEAIAGSKPGLGFGSDSPKPIPKLTSASTPGTEPVIAGSKPGLGAGSGGIEK